MCPVCGWYVSSLRYSVLTMVLRWYGVTRLILTNRRLLTTSDVEGVCCRCSTVLLLNTSIVPNDALMGFKCLHPTFNLQPLYSEIRCSPPKTPFFWTFRGAVLYVILFLSSCRTFSSSSLNSSILVITFLISWSCCSIMVYSQAISSS